MTTDTFSKLGIEQIFKSSSSFLCFLSPGVYIDLKITTGLIIQSYTVVNYLSFEFLEEINPIFPILGVFVKHYVENYITRKMLQR